MKMGDERREWETSDESDGRRRERWTLTSAVAVAALRGGAGGSHRDGLAGAASRGVTAGHAAGRPAEEPLRSRVQYARVYYATREDPAGPDRCADRRGR